MLGEEYCELCKDGEDNRKHWHSFSKTKPTQWLENIVNFFKRI